MTTLANATFKPTKASVNLKLTETTAGLLSYVPFFASLFYNIKLAWVPMDHPRIWAMGTDGETVYINEEWFPKTVLPERVFVLCHEILHCMFDDMGRSLYYERIGSVRGLPWDWEVANKAQDYRINAVLVEAKIGQMPKVALYDPKIATAGETFELVYERVYKQKQTQPKQPPGNQPGQGGKAPPKPGNAPSKPGQTPPPPPPVSGSTNPAKPGTDDNEGNGTPRQGEGVDAHLRPAQRTPAEAAQRKAEWEQAAKAGKAAAKAVGNLPGALEAMLDELFEPVVDWRETTKKWLKRNIPGIGQRSFKRLKRRALVFDPQIVLPGRSAFGAENVVQVYDTSGSMDEDMFKRAITEGVAMMMDVRPRTLWVIQGDAAIADIKRLPEGTGARELMYRKGFGGTNFVPAFEAVAKLGIRPDVLIYFTDLDGPYPENPPPYPVLWCCTTKNVAKWGTTIHVDI